jgi:hypothetical protein
MKFSKIKAQRTGEVWFRTTFTADELCNIHPDLIS